MIARMVPTAPPQPFYGKPSGAPPSYVTCRSLHLLRREFQDHGNDPVHGGKLGGRSLTAGFV